MSPAASDAQSAPAPAAVATEQILHDGEVVLLAVKPSGWFIVLTSLPVLAVLAVVAVGGHYLGRAMSSGQQTIEVLCAALGVVRLVVACCQWAGTLYLLTNQRVLRVRSALKITVVGCLLREIERTDLSVGVCERLLGVGSLLFQTPTGNLARGEWLHLARPAEVLETVNNAVRRAR